MAKKARRVVVPPGRSKTVLWWAAVHCDVLSDGGGKGAGYLLVGFRVYQCHTCVNVPEGDAGLLQAV